MIYGSLYRLACKEHVKSFTQFQHSAVQFNTNAFCILFCIKLSVDTLIYSPKHCIPDITCVVLFGACIEGVLLRDK